MSPPISTTIKAARQLGISSLAYYARYQVGLYSGYYRRKLTPHSVEAPGSLHPVFVLPSRQVLLDVLGDNIQNLLQEAGEIVTGRVRLFGSEPVPLQLVPPGELAHWTDYEKGRHSFGAEDIKILWEPARFGWAFTLGRAYLVTGEDKYARAFWQYAETFLDANPAYLGPNWYSGQEAALRLFAFVFAWQVFAPSIHSTTIRHDRLRDSIAAHAARLPLTLVYAQAQNNNHLLTEAAGLYTAGLALPEHPEARQWKDLGWRLFNQAVRTQIAENGVYIQHSTNYHRLMLQTILWVISLKTNGSTPQPLPSESRTRAAAATRWLRALVAPSSGRAPNLGPNDGAYILPFTTCPFHDFRPILAAAGSAFLGDRPFPHGPIDEMILWLGMNVTQHKSQAAAPIQNHNVHPEPLILRNRAVDSWAYLRAASFTSRPGHADQLHLDLWWHGMNVALDPGTFRYNSPPPWDNSLGRTEVHNTVCINNTDQMTRAGRFLWLDWAQAQILDHQSDEQGDIRSVTAQHDGYRKIGVLHRRNVAASNSGWHVQDELVSSGASGTAEPSIQARLHWLLPDWPWEIFKEPIPDQEEITYIMGLKSTYGWVHLRVSVPLAAHTHASESPSSIQLVRAGELLSGTGVVSPIWGWYSPTYNHRVPALSFSVIQNTRLHTRFSSEWIFP